MPAQNTRSSGPGLHVQIDESNRDCVVHRVFLYAYISKNVRAPDGRRVVHFRVQLTILNRYGNVLPKHIVIETLKPEGQTDSPQVWVELYGRNGPHSQYVPWNAVVSWELVPWAEFTVADVVELIRNERLGVYYYNGLGYGCKFWSTVLIRKMVAMGWLATASDVTGFDSLIARAQQVFGNNATIVMNDNGSFPYATV